MLAVLFCVRYRRRRAAYEHPNLSDFVIVDSEGEPRIAGEGVPRTTGEEEDSFLQRSSEASNAMREADSSARLVTMANLSRNPSVRTTGTQIPPEGVIPEALKTPPSSPENRTGPKTPSPFFHASASSLFFNPVRGSDPTLAAGAAAAARNKRDSGSTNTGSSASPVLTMSNIIPPRDLMALDNRWREESAHQKGTIGRTGSTSELGERLDVAGHSLSPPPPTIGHAGSRPSVLL